MRVYNIFMVNPEKWKRIISLNLFAKVIKNYGKIILIIGAGEVLRP